MSSCPERAVSREPLQSTAASLYCFNPVSAKPHLPGFRIVRLKLRHLFFRQCLDISLVLERVGKCSTSRCNWYSHSCILRGCRISSGSLAPCEVDCPVCDVGVGLGCGARRGLVEPACAWAKVVKTKRMLMKAITRCKYLLIMLTNSFMLLPDCQTRAS